MWSAFKTYARRAGDRVEAALIAIARALMLAGKALAHALWQILRFVVKLPGIRLLANKAQAKAQPLIDNIQRHIDVWHAAWEHEKKQEPIGLQKGKELEFLPAALEIHETPPAPLARSVATAIVVLFAVAVLWATFGHIDIVATATGKIIPDDYSKVIQPLESGVIKAIHVRDGQAVHTGDALIDLDTTGTDAEQDRVSNEYRSGEVEMARLNALLAGRDTFTAPAGADPNFVAAEQRRLHDQLAEYRAHRESLKLQIDQRQSALEGTKINIARLEQTLPMIDKRADAFKKLSQEGFVSQAQYLELESQRVDKEKELAGQRYKLIQDTAALSEAQKNYQAMQAEFSRTHRDELSALQTKTASLAKEVIKATQKSTQQKLTAPIDGVVQQLAVHTLGGVVTPAQTLMVIVPKEHQLSIEAYVENKDIGFVNPTQPVEIKVETFPFTRYGTIPGRVMTVSQDAVPIDKVGFVYAARVSMERSKIHVEDKELNLTPGMNVTVEIKTGDRRLIEYFLSPLLRYKQESVHER